MKTASGRHSCAGFNVQLRCTLLQVKAALSFARFVFAVAYCLPTSIIGTYSLGVRTGRHTCMDKKCLDGWFLGNMHHTAVV